MASDEIRMTLLHRSTNDLVEELLMWRGLAAEHLDRIAELEGENNRLAELLHNETHYNDAVSAGKVSVDVKRELTDAEIEELGAQEAERKEFCPNCEAETPCTHEAELFVCDICGEDFAKYIVSRNCTLPDVLTTQDVLSSIKTSNSIENTDPDYYKQELVRRDALIERLIEAGNVLVDQNDMDNGAVMAAEDEWRFLVTEWKAMKGGE